MEIKEAIRMIANPGTTIRSLACRVNAVDKDNGTCELLPLDGSPVLKNVRLSASESKNNTLVVYPKTDSFVIATMINMNDAFVSMTDEADEIVINPHGKISVQNDEEDLKTLLDDLINEIKNITVTTGTGPSGTPVNFAAFDILKQRFDNLLNNAQ